MTTYLSADNAINTAKPDFCIVLQLGSGGCCPLELHFDSLQLSRVRVLSPGIPLQSLLLPTNLLPHKIQPINYYFLGGQSVWGQSTLVGITGGVTSVTTKPIIWEIN